jgi:hypothetical protein
MRYETVPDLELLPLAGVIQAVPDEDVIDVFEGGDVLVVPAGREQAADELAVPPLVDDLTRRQVRLRRQQQPDHVFEVGAIRVGLPAYATDGGAVAEEEDLELSRLPAPGRNRQGQEGDKAPGLQKVAAPHPTGSPGLRAAARPSPDH